MPQAPERTKHTCETRSKDAHRLWRATSPLTRFTASVATALTLFVGSSAQAQVHNSYGSYTVFFDAQSTAFNGMHLTNGYDNELCCFGRHQTASVPDDYVLLKFVADPGYSFTSMSMGFTQFYLQTNAFQGYISYHGDWGVSTGTFAPGSDSYRYDFISDHIGWDQTGTGGTFFRSNQFWNSGGVHSFIPIMSATGIDFDNVSEFTLEMNIGGAAGGVFGTYLSVNAQTVFEPAVTAAPEPQTYAMVLTGLGLIGFVRRRSSRTQRRE